MRGYKKFLFKNQWHVFTFFLKKRIVKFKRTKWKKIKSKIFYTIRQYNSYKKRLISLYSVRILKILSSFKQQILKKKLFLNTNFLSFLKKIKYFLLSKKYKKLKRNLKYKLKFFFNKPFYQKYQYFKKCLSLFFFNYKTLKVSNKFHIRYKFLFKNMLFMKSTILKYYSGCFTVRFFKTQPQSAFFKMRLLTTLVKPELRLDIILWRLKFFNSPYLARFAIQKKLVLVNNLIINKTFQKQYFKVFINKGDIISLNSSLNYDYQKNKNSYFLSLYLPSTFEFDYYTNTIILLKSISTLNFKDINSLLKEPLCIYQFKNYIFK
jgi:hypothetical protein